MRVPRSFRFSALFALCVIVTGACGGSDGLDSLDNAGWRFDPADAALDAGRDMDPDNDQDNDQDSGPGGLDGDDAQTDTSHTSTDTDPHDAADVPPSTDPLALDDYLRAAARLEARTLCRAYWNCPRREHWMKDAFGPFSSIEDCRATLRRAGLARRYGDGLPGAVERSTITYDARAARRCIAALQADLDARPPESCDTDVPAPCRAALTGTRRTGESCVADRDCAGDGICRGAPDTCGGTCGRAGHKKEGASCKPLDFACAAGLVCAPPRSADDGGPWRCEPAGRRGAGVRCGGPVDGDQEVYAPTSCEPGMLCPAPRATCTPLRIRDAGDHCTVTPETSEANPPIDICRPGLHCATKGSVNKDIGTCRPVPEVGLGDACTNNCRDGLFCASSISDPRCRPVTEVGGRCSRWNHCLFQCVDGRCAPPQPRCPR